MSDDRDVYEIDQGKLDKEWLDFPRRFHKAAIELADRKADHERAKADRELTAAELDKEIRLKLERSQQKATETIVANAVIRDKRMRNAVERAIKAKHDMDIAAVLVDTLDGVKKALENNVDLFGMNYFSQPRARGENREAAQRMERDSVFGKRRKSED